MDFFDPVNISKWNLTAVELCLYKGILRALFPGVSQRGWYVSQVQARLHDDVVILPLPEPFSIFFLRTVHYLRLRGGWRKIKEKQKKNCRPTLSLQIIFQAPPYALPKI
jgi:hypothetical protein